MASTPGETDYLNLNSTNANHEGYYYTEDLAVNDSLAKVYFTKHSAKMSNASWDGVIPAGGYFSVECWSTNDKYIGYNNAFNVHIILSCDTYKIS